MTSHLLIMQPLIFFPILLNHFFPFASIVAILINLGFSSVRVFALEGTCI